MPTFDSHPRLLERMLAANYPPVIKNGVCIGLAFLAVIKILQSTIKNTDNNQLNSKFCLDDFTQTMNNILNNPVDEFAKNVGVYTAPYDEYQAYFNSMTITGYAWAPTLGLNLRINDSNPSITAPLIIPDNIKNEGGIDLIGNYSGIYDLANLIIFLKSIKESVRHENYLIPFTIINANHSVTLLFHPQLNTWLIVESNVLPYLVSDNDEIVAKNILVLFSSNEKVAFQTQFYALGSMSADIKQKVMTKLDNDFGWKTIHTVTPTNAKEIDNLDTSWLMIAARTGNYPVVHSLLQHGANVHQRNKVNNADSLYYAATSGNVQIVQTLIDCGAPTDNETSDGMTALTAAIRGKYPTIIDLLLNNNASLTLSIAPLTEAAMHNDIEIMQQLVDKNADINRANSRNGTTPLINAVVCNNIEAVAWLLARDADVSLADSNGVDALLYAIHFNFTDIVKLLCRKIKDINEPCGTKWSYLQYACLYSTELAILNILLEHGADPNFAIPNTAPPLIIIAELDCIDSATLLRHYGALPETEYLGKTAVDYASALEHNEMVDFLTQPLNAKEYSEDVRLLLQESQQTNVDNLLSQFSLFAFSDAKCPDSERKIEELHNKFIK